MQLLAALALAPGTVGAAGASAATALGGPAGPGSYFISSCSYSHHGPDDPIVFPREPGFSHDHTFIGNVSTDAFSTLASLRAAATTCQPDGDTAAYWAPTLYLAGSPVLPDVAGLFTSRSINKGTATAAGTRSSVFARSCAIV